MNTCNLMTGAGFNLEIMGGFSMAWLAMVLLFFIVIFARKWLSEAGVPFNTIGAWAGAYVPYVIVITITCSAKWSLAAGIIGFVVGAFFAGTLFGDDGY